MADMPFRGLAVLKKPCRPGARADILRTFS